MKIFKDVIRTANHELILDKVVEIHKQSNFDVEFDADDARNAYSRVLNKLLSFGEWTWFRDKYVLVFRVGDAFANDDDSFIDTCLRNKKFEPFDESLKPWGGNYKDKNDAPDGYYNMNYENHNKFVSASFMPWRVLINLEFEVNDGVGDIVNTTEDLIAEFLYEITFDGYSESSYTKLKRSLKKQIRDIDSGKEELIPWEDVKKNIKDWVEDRTPDNPTPSGSYSVKFSKTAFEQLKNIVADEMTDER